MRVMAIDGPAGSGKSTVARAVAGRIGLPYLDTGAMYRAVTAAALRRSIDVIADPDAVAALADACELRVTLEQVSIDGVDVTDEIRGPAVSAAVSTVAANAGVREAMVRRQRAWVAGRGGAVLEGRDIGTVVFPDARLKVFLTASDATRVARRTGEGSLGSDPGAVAADLARRDRIDATRATGPLATASDAVTVDTTDLGIAQVVDVVVELWERAEERCMSDEPGTSEVAITHSAAAGSAAPSGDPAAPSTRSIAPSGDPVSAHTARAATSARIDAAWNLERPTLGARAFYALCRTFVRGFTAVWFRLEVIGTEHVPSSGSFIVAPVHRSNLDTPLVAMITRRPLRFMGKDSLWRSTPALSWVLSALGGFPVARGTADRDALRRCQAVLDAGQPLVMFPEGTRQHGPQLHALFDGPAFLALRAGVPIVPVGIGGSERAQARGRTLIRPTKVRIVVGPPIHAPRPEPVASSRASRRAVRELTDRLRVDLQALFDQAQAGLPR